VVGMFQLDTLDAALSRIIQIPFRVGFEADPMPEQSLTARNMPSDQSEETSHTETVLIHPVAIGRYTRPNIVVKCFVTASEHPAPCRRLASMSSIVMRRRPSIPHGLTYDARE